MSMFLIAMAIGLIFVTLGLFRLGYANEMRSRAQRAADAAAIAAVTPLRDGVILPLVLSGVDPSFGANLGFLTGGAGPGAAAAAAYAAKNESMLDPKKPPHPSGIEGRTMQVSVLTLDCEVTSEGGGGGGPGARPCKDRTGRTGLGQQGNATATAKLRDFTCNTVFDTTGWTLFCENRMVWSHGSPTLPPLEIRKLFEIDLVDGEDKNPFTGGFLGGGSLPGGSGGDTVAIPGNVSKDCPDDKVTPRMCKVRNTIMAAFKFPKGVGCFREVDPLGEHDDGNACDFMTDLGCNTTAAGKQLGNMVANFAVANAKELGIQYVIWQQRIWNISRAGEGWRMMENRGSCTANHMDHVHITVQAA